MIYKTLNEQMRSHTEFLRSNGLEVEKLKYNEGFIRCKLTGQVNGRGELCYKTTQSVLNNGMIGFATWCRCEGGITKTFKTYGLRVEGCTNPCVSSPIIDEQYNVIAIRNAELFWKYSPHIGESDYLRRKRVGYYRIRFRANEYGKVAVIPLCDVTGKLLSYQLLNPDGTKRVPKNIKISGLFHTLQPFVNGQPIGLAESYVVAATCYELTGISTITAISSNNLEQVALILRNKYPNSRIIIFADNDRHIEENKGLRAAFSVMEKLGINCTVVIPDFEGYPKSRDYTDWNDLVHEKGGQAVRVMLEEQIRR